MSEEYRLDVQAPCTGSQQLLQHTPTLYIGPAQLGDFSYVSLYRNAAGTRWEIAVLDFRTPPGPCYGVSLYAQMAPDPDPAGVYGKVGANGQPDLSLGQATIIEP